MEELKSLRTHTNKYFDLGNGQRVCRQGLGLVHYFDGKEYKDIVDIPFPEGKEIQSAADLGMIDIPEWAEVEISEDKTKAWFKDKKGVRIHKFADAFVCHKDTEPYSLVDKNGVKTQIVGSEIATKRKEVGDGEKIVLDETKITRVKFASENGKLSFALPKDLVAKDLKAFDSTDNNSTNNKDSYVRSSAANTNYGSDDFARVIWNTTGSVKSRYIVSFTLSSGSGTISDIKLYLWNYDNWNVSGQTMNLHSLTRSDWVESEVTWNNYKSGSTWTTAGGDYSATVIDTIASASANSWMFFGLVGSTATNPLTLTWGDTVNLLAKFNEADNNAETRIGCKDAGGTSAYIEITYSASIKTKVNIGDTFKTVTKGQVNIGDTWKNITKGQVNIGDTWKTIF